MAQNRQWIPLDECITDYMNEAEYSQVKYRKLWYLAFRALSELGMDAFYSVKSVKLPVNANLTVTLPADYVNYFKVGVLNQQGDIIPMGVNNNLTAAFDLSPTRVEQTQDDTIPTQLNEQGVWWYNYWNGVAYGPIYGLPSGTPYIGSYKIDNANGVIILSQNFNYDYVMLEYIASPQIGGEYYVPVQFKEAVIAFIRWKDVSSVPVKSRPEQANVEMRRRDYYNERGNAIARYDPIRLPELYEWHLQSMRLTVKA